MDQALQSDGPCVVEILVDSGKDDDAFCGSADVFDIYGLRGWRSVLNE